MIENITALALKTLLDTPASDYILLDVRELHEYEQGNLGGYHIPLGELAARLNELDQDKTVIVHCRSGYRSQLALNILQQAGFSRLKHFSVGVLGWAQAIDPLFPVS